MQRPVLVCTSSRAADQLFSRSASDRGTSPASIRFPPDNFKHSLTLFSKSFSSLPRGTCSLSVSRPYLLLRSLLLSSMATTASSTLPRNYSFTPPRPPSFSRGSSVAQPLPICLRRDRCLALTYRLNQKSNQRRGRIFKCEAAEVSSSAATAEEKTPGGGGRNWVPVVPLSALPKGERRVIIQDDETILLMWYKNEVFAIENRSPAEGAYSEGLLNAKLTQDGCIVCPSTDSTFDLRTGEIREWYPKNPVLRVLTPALRKLFVYPVKFDEENIYISMRGGNKTEAAAEIVFSGKAQPGLTASNVNVDEVRMVVDEGSQGFGFTVKNEVINGKAAVIGFLLLLDFELLTGKGLLKGTGFLDFLYSASDAFK